MNLPLFISRRIYSDNGAQQKVSRPAIRIATAGVAIGLAVMIVSVCIVFGFKHTIRDKVIGFGGHINVGNLMSIHTRQEKPIGMADSMMTAIKRLDGVKNVQRYTYKQGILKTDNDFLGVMFKGIAAEYDTTFIHNNLVSGSIPQFSDSKSSNSIVISKIMADQLKLKAGDRVFAYFIDNNDVRMRRFTVSGVYQTNLTQYDKAICLTDLYTAGRLNGWNADQVTGAEVTINDFNNIDAVEDLVVQNVNRKTDSYGETYSSETIQDANPQIFSWLNLLDLNVWIILALMLCVAGITMISGLLIIILERTNMIGVLKALGAKNKTIRRTFLWFAVFIIGKGMIIGNAIGLGLVILQHFTGLFKLDPTTYYVKTVPVEIDVLIILLLNVATLFISVFVLVAPSFLVSRIHPAKSMRYE
ncbi:MAG: ABC transporter permease [Prevotellaceae bacterium]|nr:ABC transporter permease [Prevotellaceae bacterium]